MKRRLFRTRLRAALNRLGVLGLVKGMYNRHILSRGWHEADVGGHRLRFRVFEPSEIVQIDGRFGEDEYIERILSSLKPGDVVYDIGANIGMISLAIAAHLPGVEVHAFEPGEENCDRLRQNTGLNSVAGVRAHRYGLGRQNGPVKFFLSRRPAEHSLSRDNAEDAREVEVELRTADSVAEEIGPPTIMKIDVEGAEAEVLFGAERLIGSGKVREMFIEFHKGRIFTPGFDVQPLREWVLSHGYRSVWEKEDHTAVHEHFVRA